MKIEIGFEINEEVWYIEPKLMKAKKAKLKSIKVVVDKEGCNLKYNLDIVHPNDEFYVRNIFKTKEDLLKSL